MTEELVEGFKLSTASYSLSLLRPDIFADLDLGSRGLSIYAKDPQMFVPLPDGRHFFVWRDPARTREEVERIHPKDADGYERFGAWWEGAVGLLRPFVESSEPPSLLEVERFLRSKGRADVWEMAIAGSAAANVESFFTAPEIAGAFASQGIIGTALGPREPGTAWVMAYHFMGGELVGSTGTWAYVRGGMGSVTKAIASAAADLGVEMRLNSEVEEVLIDDGSVRGVRLATGETIATAKVLSNADPLRTFRTLVPQGALSASTIRKVDDWHSPGSVVKVNLALSELPDFVSLPGTDPGPQHAGTIEISPSVDYLHDAWLDSTRGECSSQPFMEVFIQSATDATLAPPGAHVLSAFTQWAPPSLTRQTWASMKPRAYEAVMAVLASRAPNLPDAVLASEVLGPPDLEERFGLTGGNIFHGEITPDQSFGERFPYRTEIAGLYLCGSGASPGGGVMGAAGRNAARCVIADMRSAGQPVNP